MASNGYIPCVSSTPGAYNITREAQQRSQAAQNMVDGTNRYLDDSKAVRERVEKLLEDNLAGFNDSIEENRAALGELNTEITDLSDKIQGINTMVCIHVFRIQALQLYRKEQQCLFLADLTCKPRLTYLFRRIEKCLLVYNYQKCMLF